MAKGVVIILDCCSTASNYIYDIVQAGYTPLLMEFPVSYKEKSWNRSLHDFYYSLNGDLIPEIILAGDTYEETLEIVKKINPITILPGSDKAIEWATKLSFQLSLRTNNPEILPYIRNKFLMQKKISEAGLRSIRGALIHSYDEAIVFFQQVERRRVVIKPIDGNATIGVCICENEKDIKDAMLLNFSLIKKKKNATNDLLIQEYIEGTEYVVNTASSGTKHIVLSVMKYDKILVKGRGKIYNYVQIISPRTKISKSLINYARSVLNAIGLSVGPSHLEIMVDHIGPVLIEINCRPCGGLMKRMWLEKFLTHHETNISLDSYLFPEKFDKHPLCFEPYAYAIIKPIIVPKDIYAESNNLYNVCCNLKSFIYELDMGGKRLYPKTVDFSTNGGFVFLCHNNLEIVMEDCKYIHNIETNHINEIFS